MSRYLDIADRALASITEYSSNGCKPMDTVTAHYETNEFNERRSIHEKLRTLAGKDWDEVSSDPEKLQAFFAMATIKKMREKGIVPDHYTATTECRLCGTVPIWEGCPPNILGCPWCFNRIKGLPIPHKSGDDFL